ncbi:hypothetical protein JNB62_15885 [Microbacterium jejuense]|uniref:Secreted protein n=1 Tax=Microbacterium jejuense TaxID=1263637 RepID=A0ABS7HQC2_9MICO|nr:hypothetical protein [Microbacterium jejuense]MBW9095167.1 hypothetical protein [Microbacterium jejuense]
MTGQYAGILAVLALVFATIAIVLALAAMTTLARAARAPRRNTHRLGALVLQDVIDQQVANAHTTTHRPPTHIFSGSADEGER